MRCRPPGHAKSRDVGERITNESFRKQVGRHRSRVDPLLRIRLAVTYPRFTRRGKTFRSVTRQIKTLMTPIELNRVVLWRVDRPLSHETRLRRTMGHGEPHKSLRRRPATSTHVVIALRELQNRFVRHQNDGEFCRRSACAYAVDVRSRTGFAHMTQRHGIRARRRFYCIILCQRHGPGRRSRPQPTNSCGNGEATRGRLVSLWRMQLGRRSNEQPLYSAERRSAVCAHNASWYNHPNKARPT
jgi:hypothetical protein